MEVADPDRTSLCFLLAQVLPLGKFFHLLNGCKGFPWRSSG